MKEGREVHLHILRKTIFAFCAAMLLTVAANAQFPAGAANQNEDSSASPMNRPLAPQPQINPGDQFAGSVAEGKATDEVLKISILDAIDRGLKHNLGLLLG